MTVKRAALDRLDEIFSVYLGAREYMKQSGNPDQWGNVYPPRELVRSDIEGGNLYLLEDDGELCGVFAFFEGDDPDYARIDGEWLNDEPYCAIHRVASTGRKGGVVAACVRYGLSRANNLRIDTHEQNAPMQNALARAGFVKCGTVTLPDGSLRIAFHLCKE